MTEPVKGYAIVDSSGKLHIRTARSNRHDSWQSVGVETDASRRAWVADGVKCVPVEVRVIEESADS